MKIVLINPCLTSDRNEFMSVLSEPLGLISLATYIGTQFENKTHIKILDLYAMDFNKIRERGDGRITRGISDEREIAGLIQDINPEVVGIQCNFTGFSNDAMEIAGIVKKALPNTVVVLGGAHASCDSENILNKHSCIDYIVRGEGEVTFYELVKAIRDGNSVNNIYGIAYRDKDRKVFMTPPRELVEDMDTFPMPDRKYIDMKAYSYINRKSFPVAMQYPVATVVVSRGCPYDCIFCSAKDMWGHRWRARSPRKVIHEIEELVVKYGIKEIAFWDDQFVVNKKWVNEVCDLIIEKKYGISLSLPNGVSVWLTDEHLLRKMKRAGFYRLCFPIESGNLNSLKFIRKPVNLKTVVELIKCAAKMGFWTSANFIIGFPYESKEEIKETIDFAYTCGIEHAFFFVAKPRFGADMYDIYKKEGLLEDAVGMSSSLFIAKCDTLHCTAEELTKIRADAERRFPLHKFCWSLRPSNFINYVLPKISSLKDIRYIMRILSAVVLGKYRRSKKQ